MAVAKVLTSERRASHLSVDQDLVLAGLHARHVNLRIYSNMVLNGHRGYAVAGKARVLYLQQRRRLVFVFTHRPGDGGGKDENLTSKVRHRAARHAVEWLPISGRPASSLII